ncbi:MAG: acyltransferase [Alphaproteobacteria bacterium]|nr:acyltransferase [Alphaproteobacteria bacterium]
MFDLFRYRLLRHVPVKRIKEHYERKYRTYLCENKLMDYDTLTASDIFKNNALNVPKENFDNIALNIASDGNSVTIEKNPRVGRISIEIKGKNNKIRLGDMSEIVGTLDIHICGNDSETDIGNIWIGKGGLTIYNAVAQSQNTRVFIGDGCTFESCTIISYHSNTSVVVGEKCMFSDGITLINSDTHPIYDYETKELSNKAKRDIVIGNHCWVGHGVSVMKNVSVPDDCIIGWNAVVTKSFDESHCAIAGNPAKIVKRGVTWDCFDENLFV